LTPSIQLAVDLHALQVAGFADRGIGRYTASHVAALARAGRVAGGLLAPELPPPSHLPTELSQSGLVDWDTITKMRELLQGSAPLAYHVTAPFLHAGPMDPFGLTVVPHWAEAGVPRVVTLYDLIPLRDRCTYLPTPSHVERYEVRAEWVAASDLVLAISEFTRAEAIELLGCDPGKVVTVGAGVAETFTPLDGTDDELFAFYLPKLKERQFVLTVGGSDPRKGTELLVGALGRLRRQGLDLPLVVVGDLTDAWRQRLAGAAEASGLGERLVMTGPITDDLLRACYRRAAVTVLPSTAEGLGLPVLESAACGTPALTSCTTALPEVAVSPLATFDPFDAGAIAESVSGLLSDPERRAAILSAQQQLAARSTWEEVATRTVSALDALSGRLARWEWGRPPARRRIALVGPLPPSGGGIGAYNDRLVRAMPSSVIVDAVTPRLTEPRSSRAVRHVPADAFGSDVRPGSYDGVVYTLGNSDGHLATVELALRHPGWVWLHEVRLPAIAVSALEDFGDQSFDESFSWLLRRSYRDRAPIHAARRAGRSVLELVDAGAGLVPLFAERCRGLLVNSQVARRLLLLDLAAGVHLPPVHVLPPACPPPRPALRPAARSTEDVVVAFGVVSMAKRPDVLVDAAALAGFRLAFVGHCPPILAQVISERAQARGVSDRVEVAGAVDEAGWAQWLGRACIAVQLRDLASGESSAAVLEALAAGVPVVTNLAVAAEYGNGTVCLLGSLDPEHVATQVTELLESTGRREALSRSGLEFASDHQFERLARVLVETVAG